MRSIPLGRNDTISEIMLGTMTYGTQTPEADAHNQIDMAVDAGVTWLDTAEVYPVNPMTKEGAGRTEEIVGTWIAKGNSGRIKIATKHGGEGGVVHDGAEITPESIPRAIEGSLMRLQSEVIDLYQFHWPNRGSYCFRQYWHYRPKGDRAAIVQNLSDCIGALEREIERGTIRAHGPSNESAWGLSQMVAAAGDGPGRPVSLQNDYNLTQRQPDTDVAEVLRYEDITMLAYSPLAAGLLTGKYQGGALPEGSRMSINGNLGGRWNDRAEAAVQAYLDLAAKYDIDPVHMSLAWLQTRPFHCSAILGATTSEQLAHGLKSQDMTLPDDLVAEIDATHKQHPLPY